MSRLAIAAHLLEDNMFDQALSILEKDTVDLENLTLRSHILRYFDRYEDEAGLFQLVRELGQSNAYLNARGKWHSLPLFDRLVGRAPLGLPKNPLSVPRQETLEQLCFVTAMGSDQPYFNVGIELIESIKNTKTYKDIPICILDAGLTDEDKQYLIDRFGNITIKDPGIDLDIVLSNKDFKGDARSANGLKGCLARPFIPKHFPGYRYYVWFDTDVWIQDERSLDLFIVSAEQHGVSSVVTQSSGTQFKFPGSWWHQMCQQYKLVPEHFLPVLLQSPAISAGTLCIDNESGFFDLWAKYMKEAVEYSGQVWGPDELTYMYTRQRHFTHTPVLGFEHNYALTSYGLPLFGDQCLLTPYSAEPIGMFHFCGMRKDQWFAPLIESRQPVDIELNKSGQGQRGIHSIHFRDWPWQDKTEIRSYLTGYMRNKESKGEGFVGEGVL